MGNILENAIDRQATWLRELETKKREYPVPVVSPRDILREVVVLSASVSNEWSTHRYSSEALRVNSLESSFEWSRGCLHAWTVAYFGALITFCAAHDSFYPDLKKRAYQEIILRSNDFDYGKDFTHWTDLLVDRTTMMASNYATDTWRLGASRLSRWMIHNAISPIEAVKSYRSRREMYASETTRRIQLNTLFGNTEEE